MYNRAFVALIVTATVSISSISAFTTTSPGKAGISSTRTIDGGTKTYNKKYNIILQDSVRSTGFDSFSKYRPVKDISYGEDSRQYRRTVYTHDDWVKHRDPDRFLYYLAAIFSSGVYRNLAREVIGVTLISAAVCLYNALATGYTDFAGVEHAAVLGDFFQKAGIPLGPFTLASPSLGLLLVFRTNTSYQRWDEARKNWGLNINRSRDLNRMANTYYDSNGVSPEERQADLNRVALCTWAFMRAMKRHLSPEWEDEEDFRKELYEKLPQGQAQKIIDAAHRPNRALQDLSYAIDNCPMHFIRKNEVHGSVTQFEDNLGSSERILTSPVPVFYTRHLARFLASWLMLLPFALYDVFAGTWNHIGMIPAAAVLSLFLFGIEELGTQLEEPFTILPMQSFCDKIYNWSFEIASWSRGDNGMPLKEVKPEHKYFVSVPEPEYLPTESYELNGSYQQYSEPAYEEQHSEPVYEEPPAPEPAPANSGQLSFEEFLKSQRGV